MVPNVFNVQHFSIHDGPGIRTTIFFKGCPLRCKWCHNPESQLFRPEVMIDDDGTRHDVGRAYTVDQLVEEIARDEIIYDQSGGGATLSGGEVLAQDPDFVLELLSRLVEQEISVGIDTCGVAPTATVEKVCDDVDFFLYDLKFIDDALHRRYTSGSNRLVLRNLEVLSARGARIFLRMIMLPGINMESDVIEATMLWLRTHGIDVEQIDLLPYHRYGMNKYAKLGRSVTYFDVPDEHSLDAVRTKMLRFYPNVTIGG